MNRVQGWQMDRSSSAPRVRALLSAGAVNTSFAAGVAFSFYGFYYYYPRAMRGGTAPHREGS